MKLNWNEFMANEHEDDDTNSPRLLDVIFALISLFDCSIALVFSVSMPTLARMTRHQVEKEQF